MKHQPLFCLFTLIFSGCYVGGGGVIQRSDSSNDTNDAIASDAPVTDAAGDNQLQDSPADSPQDISLDVTADAVPEVALDATSDVIVGCGTPTAGEWHVGPNGHDTDNSKGNGSTNCPFKTIGKAITAIVSSSTVAKIILHKGKNSPARYGATCLTEEQGENKCDVTPIVFPANVPPGVSLEGATTNPADVRIGSDSTAMSVLRVESQQLTVRSVTIEPLKTDIGGNGASALVFNASGGGPSVVRDVVLTGTKATNTTAGSGKGISVENSAPLTIGPNAKINGFFQSVRSLTAAPITVVGGTALVQTKFAGAGAGCIVKQTSASATLAALTIQGTVPDGVILEDCGDNAVSDYAINLSAPSGGAENKLEQFTVTSTGPSFRGVLIASGTALLKGVQIDELKSVGALFSGTSVVRIESSRFTKNQSDNMQWLVNASLSLNKVDLSGSTQGNGLLATGACKLTLGTEANAGGNIINKGNAKNKLAGLCLLNATLSHNVGTNTFACNPTPAACTNGTPSKQTTTAASGCTSANVPTPVDVFSLSSATVTSLNAQCCP